MDSVTGPTWSALGTTVAHPQNQQDGAQRHPTQARARRTREALLNAATLEFSLRGFAATTTKSIAARAQVATGSFYQYFKNKELVLLELAQQRIGVLERGAEQSLAGQGPLDAPVSAAAIRQRLRGIVKLVVDLHAQDPGLHAVFTERRLVDARLDALTSAFEARLIETSRGWLEHWNSPGDAQANAVILFAMLEGSVHNQVLGHAQLDKDTFETTLVEALLRVVRPDLALRPGSTASLT